ncbi:MAG: hypothetical protein RIG77_20235 [Cyclobacteriaceae bacterium]
MKVIYTDQSRDSLEDLADFLLGEQGWTLEKFLEPRWRGFVILDYIKQIDIESM